jgi:hypothetical protein
MATGDKVLGLPLIAGCRFKVRRADVKKLPLSTGEKVFTLQNVEGV